MPNHVKSPPICWLHIGFDEAHDLGRGKFLDNTPRFNGVFPSRLDVRFRADTTICDLFFLAQTGGWDYPDDMSLPHNTLLEKLTDKLSNSRDFTISFLLHGILVAVFGTTVLFQAIQPPSDFETESFSPPGPVAAAPLPAVVNQAPPAPNMTVAPQSAPVSIITTVAPPAMNFVAPPMIMTRANPAELAPAMQVEAQRPSATGVAGLSRAQADAIGGFTKHWVKGPPGTGNRVREYEFTAFVGQYSGGNWNSTVRTDAGKIENGSLPNLLDFMSTRSKNKVKTNYQSVRAIRLDSDELLSVKPPFVFMTGTRDFRLSDKEVENLQKYVRLGGAVWGDSSVPGSNSRFDIAFRREMKRVIPDVDKEWEALPANHPIYSQAYFPEIKETPAGLNFYREPVYALKIFGEVAIIYTANDYGDMWQVGLDDQERVDVRKNDRNAFVALNQAIYDNRETYLRNISPESLARTYKFGTNVVIHLLTRWESKIRSASAL